MKTWRIKMQSGSYFFGIDGFTLGGINVESCTQPEAAHHFRAYEVAVAVCRDLQFLSHYGCSVEVVELWLPTRHLKSP